MIAPSWLADLLAAVVIAVALFSAARLIASRRRRGSEADADGVHVLMGVAMAGMFVPRLAILPVPLWEAVFAAGAAWFGWRALDVKRGSLVRYSGRCCRYPLPHLVDCVAMLYMLWAVPVLRQATGAVSAGMSGMAGGAAGLRLPAVALALAVCVCGYVVWLGDRIQLVSLAPAVVHDGQLEDAARAPETSAGPGSPGARMAGRPLLAPRAATCCKIAMGLAMGVMLIDLL